jgi:rhodanese-related sulfurtransferase
MFKRVAAALLLSLSMIGATQAADAPPPTPTSVAGGKVIGLDEAKALAGSKGAVFIDTRSTLNFGRGHIPGAVTASYREESDKTPAFDGSKDKFEFGKLPQDKAAKIVFYSDGPTGWKSYKAAVLAIKQGYTGVHYFRGGFDEWSSKGLTVER